MAHDSSVAGQPPPSAVDLEPLPSQSGLSFDEASDATLKLDWNEAALGPSPAVRRALTRFVALGRLNWYPDVHAVRLRARLAEYTGRPTYEIRVFNGSDGALDAIARAWLAPGDRALVYGPCYGHFPHAARLARADVQAVLGPDPFAPEIEPLLDRLDTGVRVVYLVNPNNPTGRLLTPPQVEALCQKASRGLVVVDEAYFEYTGVTAAELLDAHANLVVTRSFSKAFGLAGLRCGYTLAAAGLSRRLDGVRNPKDVNMLAQVAATAALEDLDHVRACVRAVADARAWLAATLSAAGVPVIATPANFVLVRVADPASVVAALRREHVYVRDRSRLPQLEGMVRITVGTRAQCERLAAVLLDVLARDGRGLEAPC
jgi:histidinol-phosphate aminotransferase